MYTFLINEDNTITASLTERIMQRSKLVDNLHFLADQTYKGVDISDYTVMLPLLPITLILFDKILAVEILLVV